MVRPEPAPEAVPGPGQLSAPVRVETLVGPTPVVVTLHTTPEPVDVLVLDTSRPGVDPVEEWLLTGTDRLFAALRRLLEAAERDPVVVLFLEPVGRGTEDPHRPVAEATFAAVQATVHSLALEHPRTRMCVVRAHDSAVGGVTDVLDLVSSTAGAYISAATIDLRSAR